MENIDGVTFIKKFGIITNKEVIIKRGNAKQIKISIDSISKVKLVKKRIIFFNIILLTLGLLTLIILLLNLKGEEFYLYLLSLICVLCFVLAFIHKFYLYSLIIKLKNKEEHVVKTTQLQRENIKDFYYAIFEKTKIITKS